MSTTPRTHPGSGGIYLVHFSDKSPSRHCSGRDLLLALLTCRTKFVWCILMCHQKSRFFFLPYTVCSPFAMFSSYFYDPRECLPITSPLAVVVATSRTLPLPPCLVGKQTSTLSHGRERSSRQPATCASHSLCVFLALPCSCYEKRYLSSRDCRLPGVRSQNVNSVNSPVNCRGQPQRVRHRQYRLRYYL